MCSWQQTAYLFFTYFLVFARFESIFPRKSSIDFLLSSSGLSISSVFSLATGLLLLLGTFVDVGGIMLAANCDELPQKSDKNSSVGVNAVAVVDAAGNDICLVNWLCWSDVSRSTGTIKYCRKNRLSDANNRFTRRICSVCVCLCKKNIDCQKKYRWCIFIHLYWKRVSKVGKQTNTHAFINGIKSSFKIIQVHQIESTYWKANKNVEYYIYCTLLLVQDAIAIAFDTQNLSCRAVAKISLPLPLSFTFFALSLNVKRKFHIEYRNYIIAWTLIRNVNWYLFCFYLSYQMSIGVLLSHCRSRSAHLEWAPCARVKQQQFNWFSVLETMQEVKNYNWRQSRCLRWIFKWLARLDRCYCCVSF